MTTTTHATTRPSSRTELAGWYEAALDGQERSGLSVAEYADEIGVTAATLYSWRRRLASRSSPQPQREGTGLVRVQVGRDAQRLDGGAGTLVVRVGRRRSIAVPPGFDAEELTRVIAVLEAC